MCEIAVNSLLPIGFPIQVSDLEVYLPRANFTSARARVVARRLTGFGNERNAAELKTQCYTSEIISI